MAKVGMSLSSCSKNSGRNAPAGPPPEMILLDLNIPDTDEREVVRKVQSDLNHKMIHVTAQPTSLDECDTEVWNQEEFNSYIVKPVETDCQ
jgi:CheY-like chemotaxis protein